MIRENIREAVKTLYDQGKKKKEIARFLKIGIKTVRRIIKNECNTPKTRSDKILVDEDIIKQLYDTCDGYIQRMYEKLNEEMNTPIGYSTLTRLVRECIPGKDDVRCKSFPDIPGEEMQHDTSDYYLKIGDKKMKVICSGIYFRYSKIRYIKFYPCFNRFRMQCFFHESLCYYGYTAKICIIDNTNLAVLHGTGENAVFNPEMISFAREYGFTWKAHRIKLSNRKAGKERNFWTLETNFFPGRSFKSLDDLNKQAKDWALNRFANRPQAKTRLIPSELFEFEKPYLIKLPEYIKEPYRYHNRRIDKFGYVSFDGNYYWIPKGINGNADVIEYDARIETYQKRKKFITYDLPAWDVKNEKFIPPDMKKPPYQPNNRKIGCAVEEQKLRALGGDVNRYLDFIRSKDCTIKRKPAFIRQLHSFSKKLTPGLFEKCIERALKYNLDTINSLDRVASILVNDDVDYSIEPTSSNNEYEKRPAYQKGKVSKEEGLDKFQKIVEEG